MPAFGDNPKTVVTVPSARIDAIDKVGISCKVCTLEPIRRLYWFSVPLSFSVP